MVRETFDDEDDVKRQQKAAAYDNFILFIFLFFAVQYRLNLILSLSMILILKLILILTLIFQWRTIYF